MTGKLQEYCLEYIRVSAILNHLRQYGGGIDEMNVVLGELEALKHRMLRELE